jgi:hypothetical protein
MPAAPAPIPPPVRPSIRPSIRIEVPGQRVPLEPLAATRVRAFKRHLIDAMRDLVGARRPERLIQKRGPEPTGSAEAGVRAACGHCGGSCCMAGGTHAFIDDRTLARVRAERPGITARALLSAYVSAVAPLAYRGSCLFHGPVGCTLDRPLRAELCNSYYCNGLKDFLKAEPKAGQTVTVVAHSGEERTTTL